MDDLISRQAAIDAICKACANGDDYTDCRDRHIKSRWCDNINALRDLPPAQPEHIRCKDCKHQEIHEYNYGGRTYHSYGCELSERYSHVCLDDDFCSRAERREE